MLNPPCNMEHFDIMLKHFLKLAQSQVEQKRRFWTSCFDLLEKSPIMLDGTLLSTSGYFGFSWLYWSQLSPTVNGNSYILFQGKIDAIFQILLKVCRLGTQIHVHTIFVQVGLIASITAGGLGTFATFLLTATTAASLFSFVVSLSIVGVVMAFFLTSLGTTFLGVVGVAGFVISSIVVIAIGVTLFAAGKPICSKDFLD